MPDAKELSCQELVELVTDYLEETIAPRERQRFEHHLSYCTPCRDYLTQMRQTIDALGHLPQESIPPRALDELLRAFRGWKTSS